MDHSIPDDRFGAVLGGDADRLSWRAAARPAGRPNGRDRSNSGVNAGPPVLAGCRS